jgi:hypothetical protein
VEVVGSILVAALAWGVSGPLSASPERPQAPVASGSASVPVKPGGSTAVALTDAETERFLSTAKIIRTKGAPKGITGSTQATMSDGTITHDAHIQTIDESKREFRSTAGVELDFRDSWMFNVAGYKLDRLIGLNMVPVSVKGRFRSLPAAVTWWADDVMMDEGSRVKKKVNPPAEKVSYWNHQVYMMRLFDQLIYNTDRNQGNMLIGSDWRLTLIDHTRAFRKHTTLRLPAHITRCDRGVFEKMKALAFDPMKLELGSYLDDQQIKAILARRDLIVARLESLGPSALFDRASGTGD